MRGAGRRPLARVEGLGKIYRREALSFQALKDVDLKVDAGDFLGITGPSGSGKSTLLHILGCLDSPTSGRYELDGCDVSSLGDQERSRLRAESIGFIFQTFNLVPRLNLLENVMLPYLYRNEPKKTALNRAREAVEEVGLGARISHRPSELSGGEMQRASIARALAAKPLMILADEPTGNLDSENAGTVLEIFKRLNGEGMTVVIVSHDAKVTGACGRTVTMKDGRLGG